MKLAKLSLGTKACGLAVVIAGMMSGCATTSKLADKSARSSELPSGFHPLVGLVADDPNHYVDGYPRYIVGDRDNMVMAYVPGGEYMMGSGPNARKVLVDPYYIDVHEVTNCQFNCFRECCKCKSNCKHHDVEPIDECCDCKCKGRKDRDFYRDYWVCDTNDDHPARAVSWWDAMAYARWAHKRLPTEAQWELAARGPHNDREYPWGNDLESAPCRVNSGQMGIDDGFDHVAPVMALAGGISPFGCYNMSGNVWEWCQDNWDRCLPLRPQGRPYVDPNPMYPEDGPHGVVDLASAVEVNPVGPLRNDEKVLRGGSYTNNLGQCKATTRNGARANVHQMNIGFRCVLPMPPSTEPPPAPQAAAPEVQIGEMQGCCLDHPYRYHQRP